MTTTYDSIATTTLTTSASTITFNNIPGTYTDLKLIALAIGTGSGYPSMRINGDTGSNYSQAGIYANGSAADRWAEFSQTRINYPFTYVRQTATDQYLMTEIDFMSYASTSVLKPILIRPTARFTADGSADPSFGLYLSTSAITSITLSLSSFAAGTTATLYGIKAE